jgi:hypothetical protein
MNLLISLFDRTGNWSRPYREAGWEVMRVDNQLRRGIDSIGCMMEGDILDWDYMDAIKYYNRFIVLAAEPCTDYAVSGARHFKAKDLDGSTAYSQKLVAKTNEIIKYFNPFAWSLENPKTRIHKLNPWIGQRPKYIFNPCDFAGYSPDPDDDRYNKETWLFGKFNDPVKKRMEPLGKEYPGFKNLGGKSLATKNARSITPLGFSYAFYEANH